MSVRTQLGDVLQTRCTHCHKRFRITQQHLNIARGYVRCSQCQEVFNALTHLENHEGKVSEKTQAHPTGSSLDSKPAPAPTGEAQTSQPMLTLAEAMYGEGMTAQRRQFYSMLWLFGIITLLVISIIQLVYYQRYQLIKSPRYQQQILNMCQVLPCDSSRFYNPTQLRMLERHVFSHPAQQNALMVTGSFINDAPFTQRLPAMLVNLSDLGGKPIANREFSHREYLATSTQNQIEPGQTIQFRLEIIDPGNQALTYEFEFI